MVSTTVRHNARLPLSPPGYLSYTRGQWQLLSLVRVTDSKTVYCSHVYRRGQFSGYWFLKNILCFRWITPLDQSRLKMLDTTHVLSWLTPRHFGYVCRKWDKFTTSIPKGDLETESFHQPSDLPREEELTEPNDGITDNLIGSSSIIA